MVTFIRKRKDGQGYSECSSPDNLVGKGRCCHVLEESDVNMELSQIQRGMYEVKVNDSTLTIKAQKESIVQFFNSLPKIDEEKQKKIIEFLKDE